MNARKIILPEDSVKLLQPNYIYNYDTVRNRIAASER